MDAAQCVYGSTEVTTMMDQWICQCTTMFQVSILYATVFELTVSSLAQGEGHCLENDTLIL